MRIGELSERASVSVRALRYYEEQGLLTAERSASGQRHYAEPAVERVRLIQHLYAAGLDWSRPVGLLVYADGSGEYGLENPRSSYLLGGDKGLAAVAKRANMVLLTPFSPNRSCSDGGGACW